jgi:hypothetical protein
MKEILESKGFTLFMPPAPRLVIFYLPFLRISSLFIGFVEAVVSP